MKKHGKTVEDTIRELRQRYKNVPSPLSENYPQRIQNNPMVPQPKIGSPEVRNFLVGDFTPQQQPRFY